MLLALDTHKILSLSPADESTLNHNLSVAMKTFFASATQAEIKDIFAHANSVADSSL